ncbi:hypothetical protein FHR81_000002 [Actinoalloteichus hoggarensis]|uniref:Uncharacterized protein n=1 Tax=Actinoalloteichus hoggarensis TaxID=1470176 RepID=A0A221W3R3_9PSEU|nr:hypothetical protein [Actinoalloteichus hoggarensis]ASO20313.1 hypothetical protein AHOG_13350 [Actinoalloteichus hoggarensis]MBB5918973.1 hypothetical protein [Actinoalloteichus hoggarensis]
MVNRRSVLHGMGGTLAAPLAARVLAAESEGRVATAENGADGVERIDRQALVSRHDLHRTSDDTELPVQVGNGRFAFGADITGLQTFAPFATMADWGWHSDPLPHGRRVEDYRGTIWDTYGRPVYYWTGDEDQPELHHWLRENPHRVNLGRIGLTLTRADGTPASPDDLTETRQHLELWTGRLRSRFLFDGRPVEVETTCDPETDAVAVRVTSPLIRLGRLAVFLDFPYSTAAGQDKFSAPYVGFWDRPDDHTTELRRRGARRAVITHRLDETVYAVDVAWRGAARLTRDDDRLHRYHLAGGRSETLAATVLFTPEPATAPPPTADAVERASAHWWPRFWRSGGAVDLAGSADQRWRELERRIVLSQYHLAVNEAGGEPPQESGLVNNGWYGKFHTEMYWWHATHYALWNRWPLLDRSTDIYERLLPSARDRAAEQGFAGARWPKMTTAEGRESPNIPTALLIWQQPHVMFLAELDYQAHPRRDTLRKWQEVLFATAEFMASFAHQESEGGRYVLGPPVMTANERNDSATTSNPAFELSYWRFGLRVAQQWRERLGLGREPHWDDVLANLAPLPVQDGLYVLYEGVEDMWTVHNTNHPDPIAPFGMLPGDGVDVEIMRATAEQVYRTWPVDDLYSWDFPLLAMNAARLGDPRRAVDFLLHERFGFTETGLPASGKSGVPSPYFPGAGGLLYAVAMMCAGWGDGPAGAAPGFPDDGRWTVRWEGLAPAL